MVFEVHVCGRVRGQRSHVVYLRANLTYLGVYDNAIGDEAGAELRAAGEARGVYVGV